MTGPQAFTLREDTLATRLGVDRTWIKTHRTRDTFERFWALGPNRSILWSDAGAYYLAEKLERTASCAPDTRSGAENAREGQDSPPTVRALLPEKCGAVAVLVAVRTQFANPRVIEAKTPWGSLVTVLGVKPKLWWPGFLLLAREQSRGVWEFEGNPKHPELGRRQPRGRTDPVWPRKPVNGGA